MSAGKIPGFNGWYGETDSNIQWRSARPGLQLPSRFVKDLANFTKTAVLSAFAGRAMRGIVQFCVVTIHDNDQSFGVRVVMNAADDTVQGSDQFRDAAGLQVHVDGLRRRAEKRLNKNSHCGL